MRNLTAEHYQEELFIQCKSNPNEGGEVVVKELYHLQQQLKRPPTEIKENRYYLKAIALRDAGEPLDTLYNYAIYPEVVENDTGIRHIFYGNIKHVVLEVEKETGYYRSNLLENGREVWVNLIYGSSLEEELSKAKTDRIIIDALFEEQMKGVYRHAANT